MKGQSTMEYLMTYGWAILVVIIVVSLLVSLGIFRPMSYGRKFATGFPMLGAPDDWKLPDDGLLEIVLNNHLASEITVYDINATIDGISNNYNTFNCTGDNTYMTVPPGGGRNPGEICTGADNPYSIDLGPMTEGTSYSVIISIYYNAGDAVNHTEQGTVNGIVGS